MKYSVLTFIFGDYEPVHEVQNPSKNAEYVLVTDNPTLSSNTWNIIVDEELDGLSIFDKCWSVRYNPFKYVSNDIVMKIDGSLKVVGDIDKIIDKFEEGGYDIMVKSHNYHDSIYIEYQSWVETRNYDLNQAMDALSLLKKIGLNDDEKGLIELCVCIQRNNKPNNDLNRLIYAFLKINGKENDCDRLDQTFFTFCLSRFFWKMKIVFFPQMITDFRYGYFIWYKHGEDNVIMAEIPEEFHNKYYFKNKEIKFITL